MRELVAQIKIINIPSKSKAAAAPRATYEGLSRAFEGQECEF